MDIKIMDNKYLYKPLKLLSLSAKDLRFIPLKSYIEKIYDYIVSEAFKGNLYTYIDFRKNNIAYKNIKYIIEELYILFPDVKFIKIESNNENIVYKADWDKADWDKADWHNNYDDCIENLII